MRTQRVKYVGRIRNYGDEDGFFENILGTMTYDLCGFAHAGVVDGHRGCAGCGDCIVLGTWDLLREKLRVFAHVQPAEDCPSPTLEEFLQIVKENGGTFPKGVRI